MTLPVSGNSISSSQIQTEFGGSNPIRMSQYYGLDSGIPTSGSIKFSNFYGKILNATRTIGLTQNFNARSDFQTNATIVGGKKTASSVYSNNQAVKYIIDVNGTISASSTGFAAFDTGTFPSGSSIYLNVLSGNYIIGAGGKGGDTNGAAGGAGGPALTLRLPTYITNNGTIAGGGGGGGAGGYGYASYYIQTSCFTQYLQTDTANGGGGGGGAGIIAGSGGSGGNAGSSGSFLSGGVGGAGYGSGQASSGSGGSGGNLGFAGSAGGGGNGGAKGTGGAAGNYIVNGVYVTWITTGTRLGGLA
jgi:hypothetical protein